LDFIIGFISIFNLLVWILGIITSILGFISFIIVIRKKPLSSKERVYHHFTGTFNIVNPAGIILGMIYIRYFQEKELDLILFCLLSVLFISGIFTNLITRNKIFFDSN
jgi:hypothetical protein